MKCLHSYLDKLEKVNYYDLNRAQLAKVSLAKIVLFNQRHEGEVSKMPLSAYLSRDKSETHPDIYLALSELEKQLCKYFGRIEIRGKRGRKVPVLITPVMQNSLYLLVKMRIECGVPSEIPYLIARPLAMSHYRGSDCIREYAKASGAKNPATLLSPKLRKHIGTISKVLNLSHTELDQLADFLGHDIYAYTENVLFARRDPPVG